MTNELWPCTHEVEGCLCFISPERLLVVNEPPVTARVPMADAHRARALELLEQDMPEDALWHIQQAARLDDHAALTAQSPAILIGPVQVQHSPEAEAILAAALTAEALGLIQWKDGEWTQGS